MAISRNLVLADAVAEVAVRGAIGNSHDGLTIQFSLRQEFSHQDIGVHAQANPVESEKAKISQGILLSDYNSRTGRQPHYGIATPFLFHWASIPQR